MLNRGDTLQHGRYRIVRVIGQGGMGAVYEAYDNNLSNRVALKEALVRDAALRQAFEREAKRLDRLRHIALPIVKDHFNEQGGQYLVMEYIEGQDLREMLKQRGGPFPVAQVLAWADSLLDALAYLHEEGVIHRDIKPANIKLTPKEQIILLDFGLAKGGITRQTLVGRSIYGYTLGYAPPEQMEGQGTDERSDLYALGATLYALLTGQTPDDPLSRRKYMERGLPDLLLPANQVNPQVPPHVAQALQQATALESVQRPASANHMRAMLNAPPRQAVRSDVSTIPPSLAQQPARFAQTPSQPSSMSAPSVPISNAGTSRNNRLPLLVGVLIGIVLLIGVAYMARRSSNGNDEPVIVPGTEESTSTEVVAVLPTATEVPLPTKTATQVPPTKTVVPTVIPTLAPGATAISQKDGMVQVYVPAGDFEMGSADDDPDADDDEKPRHTVYLDAFWIDQTEVTNAMFAEFVAETGHQTDAEKEGSGWACLLDSNGELDCGYVDGANWQHPQGPESDLDALDDYPVVQVSWNDATAYCAWVERRLPTEAEWEKAARGTDGRKYPWGNDAPTGELLNFCDQNCPFDHRNSISNDGYERTSPVGHYLSGTSPYGALDMAGNVWEWVSDTYDSKYYASAPRENPTGPHAFGSKVLRGGSWDFSKLVTRVSVRYKYNVNNRGEGSGFRCARSEK